MSADPSAMELPALGNTGLEVSIVGLGAGVLGEDRVDDRTAEQLLNRALDLGVTFVDTARGYGSSEERIGRFASHRRDGFVLSTKVGYGIEGHEDWTGGCVRAGVEAALGRLRTDRIDVVHLHSCPVHVLERGEVIEALHDAKQAGKIRFAAYSGENEALEWALGSSAFDVVQTSINLADQRVIDRALPLARERGLGVIAKRPLANAVWRYAERPSGRDGEIYWDRFQAMQLDRRDLDWDELALRFTLSRPGVHTAIVGTASVAHLERAIEIAGRGPLPGDHVNAIRAAFQDHDHDWHGHV